MTTAELQDQIEGDLIAFGPATARQLTHQIYGPWWAHEQEELVSRAVTTLVAEGRIRVSGITYSGRAK